MLAETKDTARKEAWAKRGAAFFQSRVRQTAPAAERKPDGPLAQPSAQLAVAARARHDMRTWQVERRKRTR